MPNTATSFNLSAYTRRQLRELATGHSLTQATVIALAVDRFYSQTITNGQPLPDVSVDHAQAQQAQHDAARRQASAATAPSPGRKIRASNPTNPTPGKP